MRGEAQPPVPCVVGGVGRLQVGRGAVDVYCKAGDIYLTNHQCWHRGAPNLSQRTRYILQVQYAARWADRRFNVGKMG